MAARFPASWVDELYARADIVQLVSNYLPLKKKGHNYWGLCPFHNEKTPSFSVNPELNVYYCFGCQAGGNIAQFVMDMERLNYPEALAFLAKQANLPIPASLETPEDPAVQSQKERMYQANEAAARYYHDMLWKPQGAKILSYLRSREVDDAAIRKFGLGAGSQEWDGLSTHLGSLGFSQDEMRLAGLIAAKDNHHYDMFRDRVMFPILNVYGKVLGFGGRAMGDAQPKYLNTADTPIFNKRYGVYAANLLRSQRGLQRIILVEGYMDVISLAARGIEGVVATLGTALTQEQARFLKRFAPEIWLAYDGDEAGQMAIERAIEVFAQEMIPVKVLQFPEGMDPDDVIRKQGIDAFMTLKPISSYLFGMRRIEKRMDLSDQDGRMEYAKACASLLSSVRDPVELDLYLKELALKSGFDKDVLLAQMNVAGGRAQKVKRQEEEKKAIRKPALLPDENGTAAEQALISLLSSGYLPDNFLKADDFFSPHFRTIAEKLLDGQTPSAVMADLESESLRSLAGKLFMRENMNDRETALAAAEECLSTLRRQMIGRKLDSLKKMMEKQDTDEKQESLREIMKLTNELSNLKRSSLDRKEV